MATVGVIDKQDALTAAHEALVAHGSPATLALACAMRRFAADALDPAERAAVRRLHAYRAQLAQSDEVIDGALAGSPEIALSIPEALIVSKGFSEGLLMFLMVRVLRPRICLELGANIGLSAAYQASALALNGAGRLVTLEGSPGRATIAARTLRELGLANAEVRVGRFQAALEPTLGELAPVDWTFIDGHHDEQATLDYFERIEPALARPAFALFDDIRWSEGMTRAWTRIAVDPRVAVAVALQRIGIAVLEASGEPGVGTDGMQRRLG